MNKKLSEKIGSTQYTKVYPYSHIGIGYTMSHKLNRNVNNEKVKFQACSIIGYTIIAYVTQTIILGQLKRNKKKTMKQLDV